MSIGGIASYWNTSHHGLCTLKPAGIHPNCACATSWKSKDFFTVFSNRTIQGNLLGASARSSGLSWSVDPIELEAVNSPQEDFFAICRRMSAEDKLCEAEARVGLLETQLNGAAHVQAEMEILVAGFETERSCMMDDAGTVIARTPHWISGFLDGRKHCCWDTLLLYSPHPQCGIPPAGDCSNCECCCCKCSWIEVEQTSYGE